MKAAVLDAYETPLRVDSEFPKPNLDSDYHLLIRVHAAGVNPVDYKLAKGDLSTFVKLPFPFIPGFDFSGVIEYKGAKVDDLKLKIGDAVYGKIAPDEVFKRASGAYAEYVSKDD